MNNQNVKIFVAIAFFKRTFHIILLEQKPNICALLQHNPIEHHFDSVLTNVPLSEFFALLVLLLQTMERVACLCECVSMNASMQNMKSIVAVLAYFIVWDEYFTEVHLTISYASSTYRFFCLMSTKYIHRIWINLPWCFDFDIHKFIYFILCLHFHYICLMCTSNRFKRANNSEFVCVSSPVLKCHSSLSALDSVWFARAVRWTSVCLWVMCHYRIAVRNSFQCVPMSVCLRMSVCSVRRPLSQWFRPTYLQDGSPT